MSRGRNCVLHGIARSISNSWIRAATAHLPTTVTKMSYLELRCIQGRGRHCTLLRMPPSALAHAAAAHDRGGSDGGLVTEKQGKKMHKLSTEIWFDLSHIGTATVTFHGCLCRVQKKMQNMSTGHSRTQFNSWN